MVDEHYYEKPEWFITNQKRYDSYNRAESKVYLGEYASRGNTLFNAIAEAAFMTSLERNGDVVRIASYAPLLARAGHTQWNPDLIYFNSTAISPSVNYYVQKLFSANQGDVYYDNVVSPANASKINDSIIATSCVRDSKTGDIILKLVNIGKETKMMKINLSRFKGIVSKAICTVLTGAPNAKNTLEKPGNVVPVTSDFKVSKTFNYDAPGLSLSVIRISDKNGLKGK